MAQPYEIDLSDTSRKSVQINNHWHGQRLNIRATNAEHPLAIGLASIKGGEAVVAKAGVPAEDVSYAYDFPLRHAEIESVVGEGRTFYFNIWEYYAEPIEGRVRVSGVVPIHTSIFVPRPVFA